jgi:hypothetical protein
MRESTALAILRSIKDCLHLDYLYGHSWSEGPVAGMVIAVREGDGYRKVEILVADGGHVGSNEAVDWSERTR